MSEPRVDRLSLPAVATAGREASSLPAASLATTPFGDRRRDVRRVPTNSTELEISLTIEIEVLDLSETGALLSCDCRLAVGDRLRLHTTLGGQPFAATLEVRRVQVRRGESGGAPKRYLLGAVFTSLDPASARALDSFLPGRTTVHATRRQL